MVTSEGSGYVRTVNFDQLESLAETHGWQIEMVSSIGAFLTCTTPVLHVWTDTPLTREERDDLIGCFAVGTSRTENQNPTFLAKQLVEMVARALSLGVNDPYTAIGCLNRLSAALMVAGTYKEGLKDPARAHVSFPHLTFDGLFAATFPLCRQYIKADTMTLHHALDLLDALQSHVRERDKAPIHSEIGILTSGT